MVNVVVHGHEPSMSEMLVAASQDPEIIAYAKAAGATRHKPFRDLLYRQ